jgi:D-alanine--poly(phosphoribitol) ligase subunit 2
MSKQEVVSIDFEALVAIILANLRASIPDSMEGQAADFDSDTALMGRSEILDSLGLVSLVVAVEQEIEDRCGISISLADERAMSQTRSPYRTVGSLAEYAARLISETKAGDD